jgi:hypothetical protein
MNFAADLHSIAMNLDATSLAEIARQLGQIKQVLACLCMVLFFNGAVQGIRFAIEIDRRRSEARDQEAECFDSQK